MTRDIECWSFTKVWVLPLIRDCFFHFGNLIEVLWLVDCSGVLVRRGESGMRWESLSEDEEDSEIDKVLLDPL